MKATTSTQFEQKFNQSTVKQEQEKSKAQNKNTSKSTHRELVLNEVNDLLKWAYNQKT